MFVVPHLIGTNFMYISEDPPYLLFFSSYTNDAKCAAGMACNNHQRERCVASEMEACWESITPQASIQPYDAENDPYCPLVRGCTVRDALYKPARALVLYTVPLYRPACCWLQLGVCASLCATWWCTPTTCTSSLSAVVPSKHQPHHHDSIETRPWLESSTRCRGVKLRSVARSRLLSWGNQGLPSGSILHGGQAPLGGE